MDSVLVHTGDEPVVLTAKAARKLLERGNGDAALLYLALLRKRGSSPPRSLAGELRWEKVRIESAEQVLRELELIAAPDQPREPEKPEYQQSDITMRLEDNPEFRELVRQTEALMGRKLTTPNLKVLLGLYDYLGLPAHIIYQLVNHCIERTVAQYGPGRRPQMRTIESEGYAWARMNLYSQDAVEKYLKKDAERRSALAPYMRVLGLGDRTPVPSEEKYLTAWLDAGFPLETVAIAYDKTVLHCHEFQWGYCNGILRRWDAEGLHTPEEVQAADKPRDRGGKKGEMQRRTGPSDEAIQEYLRDLYRG
ncbi:MAG: DnaD domain protein [Oscillibacter sp.]|nr:DnaD domain protein [Oscillibacter sp.]